MRTTLAYVLMTAVRDRLFVALAVLLGMVAVVAIFVGDGVVAEPTASRVAYAALAARLVYVLGIVLFVCYQIRRIYESREIDVILSRPLSRTGFVVAYAAGFAVVAAVLVPLPALIVWLAGPPPLDGLAWWTLSLLCEGQIVTVLALFFALILGSPVTSALAAIGFYVFARTSGAVLGILSGSWLDLSSTFAVFAGWAFRILSTVIPRLDLFGQTSWLVYGFEGSALDWAAVLQTLVYVPLLLAMAIYDFQRKQF